MEVSPTCGEAWNGRMRCTTGTDQADQEHEAMVETAHQLHETFSQGGAPALAMMRNIPEKMLPMDFIVIREAAKFAAEAYIHHMCTVANLIKTCCLEGAAYDLVTSLGPERFTEWKAALINHAAGKVPDLFRLLETDVRDGRFQPHPEEGALKYRQLTPGYGITELVFNDIRHGTAASTAHRPAEGGIDGGQRSRPSESSGEGLTGGPSATCPARCSTPHRAPVVLALTKHRGM